MPLSSGCAAWWAATSASARARRAASTSAARRQPGPARSAPWRSRRAGSEPTGAAASAAARSGVSRRREIPRGGDGSSTTPPPATAPGEGRRRANRSPGRGGDGRVEAQDRDRGHIVEVDRLARPAHHQRLGLRGAQVEAQALMVGRELGGGRRRPAHGDEDPGRGDDARIGRQDLPSPQAIALDPADQQRGAATRDGGDRRPADLDLADAWRVVAGHEPQRHPRRHRPAPQAAGHHGPATLDREHAVDREARPMRLRASVARPEAPGERRDSLEHAVDPRAVRRGRREDRRPGQRRRRDQGRGPRPRPRRGAPRRRGRPSSRRRARRGSRARRGARGARASARSGRRRPRPPAARRRSRPRRPACCRRGGRAPARRRSRRPTRPAARRARSRRRSSSRAAAPRGGGRRRCRSAP